MDKREAREYIGTNHHFNPSMNPSSALPKGGNWWNRKPTQPIQIQRQPPATSDGTGSNTASPISPPTFGYPIHKPDTMIEEAKIFKSFDFSD